MRIAVTGHKGFIGAELVEALKAREHVVVGVDIADEANPVDVRDTDACVALFEECEAVIHLAALLDPKATLEELLDTNVRGTLSVVEAARRASVRRLVHFSSAAVYHLRGKYAGTKAASESLLRCLCREYNIDSVCLRVFNAYGPTQTTQWGALIPTVVQSIMYDDTIMILGSGRQTRDFVYIDDVVECAVRVVESGERFGGLAFDVGTGWSTRVMTIVHMLNGIAHQQPRVRFVQAPRSMALRSRANTAVVRDRIGVLQVVSLQEGLSRVWAAATSWRDQNGA